MEITKNIVKFCNENGVKKVIYLSAILVYGLITKKIVVEKQRYCKSIDGNIYILYLKKNPKIKCD